MSPNELKATNRIIPIPLSKKLTDNRGRLSVPKKFLLANGISLDSEIALSFLYREGTDKPLLLMEFTDPTK